jgi:hypothetical protein
MAPEQLKELKRFKENLNLQYEEFCQKLSNDNYDKVESMFFLMTKYVNVHQYAKQIEFELYELKEQVKQLTQEKERFQHNLMYVEVVEDIINNKETEWDKKTFNNMLVKLVGKEEVYKVFVQTSNAPVIGSKIKFTFNADENKLSQLKLVE